MSVLLFEPREEVDGLADAGLVVRREERLSFLSGEDSLLYRDPGAGVEARVRLLERGPAGGDLVRRGGPFVLGIDVRPSNELPSPGKVALRGELDLSEELFSRAAEVALRRVVNRRRDRKG